MNLVKFSDRIGMCKSAADFIVKRAYDCIENNGKFSIAFSGGKTPQYLYKLLSEKPYSEDICWEKTHIFQTDERFLPINDMENNFHHIESILLNKVPIPKENIHRIITDNIDIKKSAEIYNQELINFFNSAVPHFDLILLGMGVDGHIASIFPEHDIRFEENKLAFVTAEPRGKPNVKRISFTLSTINESKCILLLSTGKEKLEIINTIRKEKDLAQVLYPVALAFPRGDLIFYYADS